MQVVNTRPGKPRDGGTRLEAFEADIDLSGAGTSDFILIPSDVNNVTVTVSFTGGAEGYIEATTDKIEKVIAGTAIWVTWTQGQVNSDIQLHIKKLSEKYKLIEIEQYLMSTVSCECAELRLRNAMKLKTERRNEKRAQLKS